MIDPRHLALADRVRRLPRHVRRELYARLDALGPEALASKRHDFERFFGQPWQVVERAHRWRLLVFAGPRGDGKSEAAIALFSREILEGRAARPRIVAATDDDIDQLVEQRLQPMLPPSLRPTWSANVLTYPNGVPVRTYPAASPEATVSTEGDLDLYDDVAKWGPRGAIAWKHARTSCRYRGPAGARGIVATTRRGTEILRKLLKGEIAELRKAPFHRMNRWNLAPGTYERLEAELGGDEFYWQEMEDLDLEPDSPFAEIEIEHVAQPAPLVAIVVFIDPTKTNKPRSCEVGIVGLGIDARGVVHGLADRSGVMGDERWPAVAHQLLEDLQAEHRGVPAHFGVEVNTGKSGVELLRAEERRRRLERGKPGVSVIEIRTVTARPRDSKVQRAQPVAALARGGQLRMVDRPRDGLGKCEGQLKALTDRNGVLLDRADAFVHGARDLAGLGDASEVKLTPAEAFAGMQEAQARMPRVDFDLERA